MLRLLGQRTRTRKASGAKKTGRINRCESAAGRQSFGRDHVSASHVSDRAFDRSGETADQPVPAPGKHPPTAVIRRKSSLNSSSGSSRRTAASSGPRAEELPAFDPSWPAQRSRSQVRHRRHRAGTRRRTAAVASVRKATERALTAPGDQGFEAAYGLPDGLLLPQHAPSRPPSRTTAVSIRRSSRGLVAYFAGAQVGIPGSGGPVPPGQRLTGDSGTPVRRGGAPPAICLVRPR